MEVNMQGLNLQQLQCPFLQFFQLLFGLVKVQSQPTSGDSSHDLVNLKVTSTDPRNKLFLVAYDYDCWWTTSGVDVGLIHLSITIF